MNITKIAAIAVMFAAMLNVVTSSVSAYNGFDPTWVNNIVGWSCALLNGLCWLLSELRDK